MPPVHRPDRTNADAALSPRAALTWLVVFLAALVWVFWPSFLTLVWRWSRDPQYTHGYVVPLFAALVLWLRRDRFPGFRNSYAWVGLVLLAGLDPEAIVRAGLDVLECPPPAGRVPALWDGGAAKRIVDVLVS